MRLDSRPPSAEKYRENLEARLTLVKMKSHESLAQTWERMPAQSLREEFAARYRELIGVHPEHRDEFREALERVKAGGGMSVQDVIGLLRIRRQANGSAADGASSLGS